MSQPRPWLNEVIEAISELGGEGTLKDITEKIVERNIMNFEANPHFESRIRSTIYHHSSDCDVFVGEKGSSKDIFYAVHGKGNGYWGLRNFEPSKKNVNLTEDDIGFPEGKAKLVQHITRERNPRVIKLAKEIFKANHDGRLFCEVCGFDFYEFYGAIGEDYIEGHHTIPVSELKNGHMTKVEDIALVCSNCHRMLHRKRPWLTKEQLKQLVTNNKL
ncbi:putative restriction endonuclease [Laceyella sacchari]|uniref:HNH endonuclease n=1 Tax=Laceyella sacchari TaxID=37482 RepID=UPI00104C952C|nr:HNH endonuclease [Laceyella sacchari]TCW35647.1 putative restriction endonuclease [Laceyella sacchari]